MLLGDKKIVLSLVLTICLVALKLTNLLQFISPTRLPANPSEITLKALITRCLDLMEKYYSTNFCHFRVFMIFRTNLMI